MLTEEQVADFIERKLSILDWREQLEQSRFHFLQKLENRYKQIMHYENISWGAKALEDLKPPSVEEVIYQCVEEGGGACLQLNYFLKLILEVLGYDVFAVGGQTKTVNDPKSHIINIVRFPKTEPGVTSSPDNKTDSVLYMVDVGFARPAPAIINLDELPHTYQCGGFTVQHRYNAQHDQYERILIGGNPIKGKFVSPDETYLDAYFTLTPRKFEEFDQTMTWIFCDPKYSFFLNTTFLFRHIWVQDHQNFEYVSVQGRSITTGNPSEHTITRFETYEEMIPHIEKYFPRLNGATLRKAIANFMVRQEKFKSHVG